MRTSILLLACWFSATLVRAADELSKPFLGITVAPVSMVKTALKDVKLRLPTTDGLVVLSVVPYSPADKARTRPFDIITTINGRKVKSIDDFEAASRQLEVGKECKLSGFSPIMKNEK